MGAAAIAMQVGGGLMQAGGAYAKAQYDKNALNYEADVATNNAIIADYQAQIAKEVGAQQEQTQRLKAAQVYGSQRATLAANGVDLGVGSAAESLATTKYIGERDALTIRDNAARQAWSYQQQAAGYRSEADATRLAAGQINPGLAAATSLLGSAGQVAGSWYSYNKSTGG